MIVIMMVYDDYAVDGYDDYDDDDDSDSDGSLDLTHVELKTLFV